MNVPALALAPEPVGDGDDGDIDRAVEIWAARTIARSILYGAGELDLHAAVDASWNAAEEVGLVATFGPDEIQAAMGLAFAAVRL